MNERKFIDEAVDLFFNKHGSKNRFQIAREGKALLLDGVYFRGFDCHILDLITDRFQGKISQKGLTAGRQKLMIRAAIIRILKEENRISKSSIWDDDLYCYYPRSEETRRYVSNTKILL